MFTKEEDLDRTTLVVGWFPAFEALEEAPLWRVVVVSFLFDELWVFVTLLFFTATP